MVLSSTAALSGQAATGSSAASVTCPNYTTVDEFVLCRVRAVLDKDEVGKNGKGVDRQKESPSSDSRSTSLVDQSSATDFISVAASLIPVAKTLTPATTGNGSGSS